MNNIKVFTQSFIHTALIVTYTAGVSWVLSNGQKIFGEEKTFLAPLSFLLLFVLSAAIVGSLVVGRPVMLYVNGQKSDALKFFGATLAWIFVFILVIFAEFFLRK